MALGTTRPWTVIGHRNDGSPIHLFAGGASDDDDGDTGIDLEGDGVPAGRAADEDDEEPDDLEEEKPKPAAKVVTQADLDRALGALEKERTAAKEARGKVRDLTAQLRAAQQGTAPSAAGDEAAAKAVEDAVAAAESRFKPMVVNEAARAALFAAGLSPDTGTATLKKLLKMIDMADVDVDEDGVSGLEDQIDQIKDAIPALFAKPEPEPPVQKVRAPRIDAAGRKNEQPKPKSAAEQHAAAALGNRS
jgi:hypothetical protein